MHRYFFIIFFLQSCTIAVFIGLPCFAFFLVYVRFLDGDLLLLVAGLFCGWGGPHNLANNAVVLLATKPYRNAIFHWFQKLYWKVNPGAAEHAASVEPGKWQAALHVIDKWPTPIHINAQTRK
ncbi:unnamed protein product, partial [Mesorhabditis spiculigera]